MSGISRDDLANLTEEKLKEVIKELLESNNAALVQKVKGVITDSNIPVNLVVDPVTDLSVVLTSHIYPTLKKFADSWVQEIDIMSKIVINVNKIIAGDWRRNLPPSPEVVNHSLRELSKLTTAFNDPNASWIVIPIQRLMLEILFSITDSQRNELKEVLQLLFDQPQVLVYGKMIHEVSSMMLDMLADLVSHSLEAGVQLSMGAVKSCLMLKVDEDLIAGAKKCFMAGVEIFKHRKADERFKMIREVSPYPGVSHADVLNASIAMCKYEGNWVISAAYIGNLTRISCVALHALQKRPDDSEMLKILHACVIGDGSVLGLEKILGRTQRKRRARIGIELGLQGIEKVENFFLSGESASSFLQTIIAECLGELQEAGERLAADLLDKFKEKMKTLADMVMEEMFDKEVRKILDTSKIAKEAKDYLEKSLRAAKTVIKEFDDCLKVIIGSMEKMIRHLQGIDKWLGVILSYAIPFVGEVDKDSTKETGCKTLVTRNDILESMQASRQRSQQNKISDYEKELEMLIEGRSEALQKEEMTAKFLIDKVLVVREFIQKTPRSLKKLILVLEGKEGVKTGVLEGIEEKKGVKGAVPEGKEGVKAGVPEGIEGKEGVKGAVPEGKEGVKAGVPEGIEGKEGVKGAVPEGKEGIKAGIPEGKEGVKAGIPEGKKGVKGAVPEGKKGVKGVRTRLRDLSEACDLLLGYLQPPTQSTVGQFTEKLREKARKTFLVNLSWVSGKGQVDTSRNSDFNEVEEAINTVTGTDFKDLEAIFSIKGKDLNNMSVVKRVPVILQYTARAVGDLEECFAFYAEEKGVMMEIARDLKGQYQAFFSEDVVKPLLNDLGKISGDGWWKQAASLWDTALATVGLAPRDVGGALCMFREALQTLVGPGSSPPLVEEAAITAELEIEQMMYYLVNSDQAKGMDQLTSIHQRISERISKTKAMNTTSIVQQLLLQTKYSEKVKYLFGTNWALIEHDVMSGHKSNVKELDFAYKAIQNKDENGETSNSFESSCLHTVHKTQVESVIKATLTALNDHKGSSTKAGMSGVSSTLVTLLTGLEKKASQSRRSIILMFNRKYLDEEKRANRYRYIYVIREGHRHLNPRHLLDRTGMTTTPLDDFYDDNDQWHMRHQGEGQVYPFFPTRRPRSIMDGTIISTPLPRQGSARYLYFGKGNNHRSDRVRPSSAGSRRPMNSDSPAPATTASNGMRPSSAGSRRPMNSDSLALLTKAYGVQPPSAGSRMRRKPVTSASGSPRYSFSFSRDARVSDTDTRGTP